MSQTTYQVMGTTDERTTCDCCGKTGLKATVCLRSTETGDDVFYGVVCAARALKTGSKDIKAAAKNADEVKAAAIQAAKDAQYRAEFARFQAFLDSMTPNVPKDWDGRSNRFNQLQALGGMVAARALYEAKQAA